MSPRPRLHPLLLVTLVVGLLFGSSCKALSSHEPDLTVTVAADGTTRVDGVRVAIPELPAILRQRGITTESEVEVLTHPNAPVRFVAEVLTAFSAVGFSPGQLKPRQLEQ